MAKKVIKPAKKQLFVKGSIEDFDCPTLYPSLEDLHIDESLTDGDEVTVLEIVGTKKAAVGSITLN